MWGRSVLDTSQVDWLTKEENDLFIMFLYSWGNPLIRGQCYSEGSILMIYLYGKKPDENNDTLETYFESYTVIFSDAFKITYTL